MYMHMFMFIYMVQNLILCSPELRLPLLVSHNSPLLKTGDEYVFFALYI